MTTQNPKAQHQKQQPVVDPPAPAADAAPQQQQQQGKAAAHQAQPQPPPPANSGKRIIVRNLPPGVTKEELRELGDRYGRVVNVELVAKPQKGAPFGFISFLTEDDAGFSIYRLHDHHYKGYDLDVSLSIPKQREAPNKNSKGATGGNRKDEKPKKTKKPMYSLRTLTPLNPPSAPPQTAQGNPQAKGWDNAAPAQVSPSVSNNSQPSGDNGYVQNQSGKGNNNNNSGKQGRKNNTNNNRSSRKQNFKAVPEPVDDVPTEAVPDHSYDANIEMIHTTEVHITIEDSQIWWTLKLAPDQLQDFYKALEPFGCYPNNH
jgi:RNA recognition motif-containing protein